MFQMTLISWTHLIGPIKTLAFDWPDTKSQQSMG